MMNGKILLRSTEAADQLGLSITTLHRMVKSGKLECIRLAENSIYFTQQQLDEFVNRHRKRCTPQHPNAGVI